MLLCSYFLHFNHSTHNSIATTILLCWRKSYRAKLWALQSFKLLHFKATTNKTEKISLKDNEVLVLPYSLYKTELRVIWKSKAEAHIKRIVAYVVVLQNTDYDRSTWYVHGNYKFSPLINRSSRRTSSQIHNTDTTVWSSKRSTLDKVTA